MEATHGGNSWRQSWRTIHGELFTETIEKYAIELPHGFSLWTKKIKIKLALAK
jgi:hypothetical protein